MQAYHLSLCAPMNCILVSLSPSSSLSEPELLPPQRAARSRSRAAVPVLSCTEM